MTAEAKKYLLEIGFDDSHLPDLFNDDDKSYYTIPELMESYHKEASKELVEALERLVKNGYQIPSNVDINNAKKALENHLK